MQISLKLPSYIKLLPDNFKILNANTSKPSDNNEEILSSYKINPFLVTAWLLDQISSTQKYFQPITMEEFKRTRRFDDILFKQYFTVSKPEMYKGLLSFKGTYSDLIYTAKLIGIDVKIEEFIQSGLIDRNLNLQRFAQFEGTGRYKFSNTKRKPEFKFENPENTIFYNKDRTGHNPDFYFENPNNTTLYGSKYQDQINWDNSCGIQVTIDITLNDSISTADVLSKLSILLINRLIPCSKATIIYGNLRIDDLWDWTRNQITDSIDNSFEQSVDENYTQHWVISHEYDLNQPPIVLDGSRYIYNRTIEDEMFMQS